MKKLQVLLFLGLFLVLLISGFFVTFRSLDPDFGWHLKTGQLILERGVPYQDWYSYTMPSFPWVDHEWLMDVFIYLIYSDIGFYGLLLCFLTVYTLSFFIIKRPGQSFYNLVFPIGLGFFSTMGFLGVRPQLFTVFFIAVLLMALYKFLEGNSKLIYFAPILFALWANLHGGFLAGLVILFLAIVLELFQKAVLSKKFKYLTFFERFSLKEHSYKKIVHLSIILSLSFLATLINAYGPRVYEEIFRSLGDNFLKFHIGEWLPLIFGTFSWTITLYIGVFLGLLLMAYKKVLFRDVAFSLIFLAFAISSQRNYLIFVIVSMPVVADMLIIFWKRIDVKWLQSELVGYKKWAAVFLVAGLAIFFSYLMHNYLADVLENDFNNKYPVEAVSFIRALPLSENMFNDYGWGGYLIWKIPERKYFIDGRMPSWRENGQFAFGDYVKISSGEPGFEDILKKYDVKLALLKKADTIENDFKNQSSNQLANIIKPFFEKHKILYSFLGVNPNESFYSQLMKSGWNQIYDDGVAVVLEKQ
jgi:hypothetical protein